MRSKFCKWIFDLTGWKALVPPADNPEKYIIVAAPHTSNWDFWYTMATFAIHKMPVKFTIKKEWMRFPFNLIMKPLGAIAIDRTARTSGAGRPSLTEAMVDLFKQHERLILVITPEGTRKRNNKWKTGFYHVAKAAGVPICPGFVDYQKKITGIGKPIYPSDYKNDMQELMAFFKSIHPRYPENFSIDEHQSS